MYCVPAKSYNGLLFEQFGFEDDFFNATCDVVAALIEKLRDGCFVIGHNNCCTGNRLPVEICTGFPLHSKR